ncbi:MAG: hypothetical protein ABFS17_10365 [Chloroflexota bacterium]
MNRMIWRSCILSIVLLMILLVTESATPTVQAGGFCSGVSEIPSAECVALEMLYSSTTGTGWNNNDDWMITTTPCSWYGVTCSGGHVTELSLGMNNLVGPLPVEIGDLPYLTALGLWVNQLNGNIPTELGNLSNLQSLQLQDNQFVGSIPTQLGNLSNLIWLNLRTNQLTGSIPTQLGNLSNLINLYLHSNELDGSIPAELGNLSNLESLLLNDNQLSSAIPAELGNLSSINYLYLHYNPLTGSIPAELGKLSTITYLHLDNTLLSGPLPNSFTNLSALSNFYFNTTSICEPQNPAFQSWITSVGNVSGTGVPCVATLLLDSDFEEGDFSEWTRVNDGNGYLYVCPAAAINGAWGACVDRGTDKRKQLIDETPVYQTAFNARFNIDMNSLSIAEGTRFRFMQVKMGADRPFFIVLKRQGGQYLIQLNTLIDGLTKVKTGWYLLSNAPHTIEVDWQAASSPGGNNGWAEIILDGSTLEYLSGLDNDTIFVDTFKIGFTSRLDGKAISGIFYLDDIATSNDGYIGIP